MTRHARAVLLFTSVVVIVAAGGVAVGYAAAKPSPVLANVCVNPTTHAVSSLRRTGCPKGTTRYRLTPSVAGPRGARGPIGATGSTGATGAQGPAGVKGDTGKAGATSIQTVRKYLSFGDGSADLEAFCPVGTTVTGGGYDTSTTSSNVHVYRSTIDVSGDGTRTGWDVAYTNATGTTMTMYVTALCATP